MKFTILFGCFGICSLRVTKYLKFPENRKIPDSIDSPVHYALLKNEDNQEFPKKFTICSSIFVKYLRDYPTFFVLLGEDFLTWIGLDISFYDIDTESSPVWISSRPSSIPLKKKFSFRPLAWSHMLVFLLTYFLEMLTP